PIDQWKRGASTHKELRDSLTSWLDFIQQSIGADRRELVRVLRDGTAASEFRMVAALLLSADDLLDVENRFYANALLITPDFHKPWQVETEKVIASLIIGRWLQIAEGERFSLLSPSVTAPQILSACRDETCDGLRKTARVLLAVRAAVHTNISGTKLTEIQQQAE